MDNQDKPMLFVSKNTKRRKRRREEIREKGDFGTEK
jgi:hypothetical protein